MVERRTFLSGLTAVGALSLVGCSSDKAPPSPRATKTAATGGPRPQVESTIASGLNVPWGIAFLANGDALVSQRDRGTVVRISISGQVSTVGAVAGVAEPAKGGEGGLLGIVTPPGDESTLFAYITTASDNRVVKMDLTPSSLGTPKAILAGIPTSLHHNGGRLLFDPKGRLYVSTGDAEQRELAQDTASLAGKILRIDQDGKAAAGNPFGNHTWTYGHRNIEGLSFDAADRLWATEFGANGADELNLIERGGNYGWPNVEGTSDNVAYLNPRVTWAPDDCSPAGLAITRSTAFLGALRGKCLFAVPLHGPDAGKPRAHFKGKYGRVRGVAQAPDGALWVTTSNTDGRGKPTRDDDRILRVTL